MIKVPTVLILGAGASMPYGFPSGQGLLDLICEGENDFKRLVSNSVPTPIRKVSSFIQALEEADPESIDVFLANNPEFEKVGKACIAAILLPRESETQLKRRWRSLRLQKKKSELGGHWYKYLSNLLHANTSFEEFHKNKLSIITFNYDRSLEHYLFTTLRANFHKKHPEEHVEKINAIKIIHIYGQLGYLPWQISNGPNIPFGLLPRPDESSKISTIQCAIKGIKTMSENFEKDNPQVKLARQLMSQAIKIYFLGFGYHPFNLEMLGMDSLRKDLDIKGTSLGLSLHRKVEVGKSGISSLNQWDRTRMNPKGLYEEDVFEFLHKHAILD